MHKCEEEGNKVYIVDPALRSEKLEDVPGDQIHQDPPHEEVKSVYLIELWSLLLLLFLLFLLFRGFLAFCAFLRQL